MEKDLQWLVGFIDAEGYFYTSKNKDSQVINITLSKRDTALLYNIKNIIGAGKVYEDNKYNKASYMLCNKHNLLTKIVPLFTKYPLLTRKNQQYQEWLKILLLRCKEDSSLLLNLKKDNYFDHWLMGFIEGDGCFYINKNDMRGFSICQKYEKSLLETIKIRLGLRSKVHMKNKVTHSKDLMYQLSSQSKFGKDKIISFINSTNMEFKGYKSIQYKKWIS